MLSYSIGTETPSSLEQPAMGPRRQPGKRRRQRSEWKELVGMVGLLAVLLLSPGTGASETGSGQSQRVAVDFDNVDLRVFIKFVSEATGHVFILDDRVKGQVSVVFTHEIPIGQLYEVLESVLEVKGFAAIPAGPVTKIVPLNTARQRGIEVGTSHPVSGGGRR
jgi:general secretion pathway protein D